MSKEVLARPKARSRTVATAVGAALLLVLFISGLAFANSVGAAKVAENARSLHWANGRGAIGREGFRRMPHHPRLRGIPFILETPNDERGGYEMDVAELKTLLKRRPRSRQGH